MLEFVNKFHVQRKKKRREYMKRKNAFIDFFVWTSVIDNCLYTSVMWA